MSVRKQNYMYGVSTDKVDPADPRQCGSLARRVLIVLRRRGATPTRINVGDNWLDNQAWATGICVRGLTAAEHRHLLGWLRQWSGQRFIDYWMLGPRQTFGANITPIGLPEDTKKRALDSADVSLWPGQLPTAND